MILLLFNSFIYVFLLLRLCILIVCLCMTTLTEVFLCFFLSCKANARVKPTKTGHGPTFPNFCVVLCIFCVVLYIFVSFYVFFVLFYIFLCCSMYFYVVLCIVCFVSLSVLFVYIYVLYYCHWVATQLQLSIYHIKTYVHCCYLCVLLLSDL
jgi:hypothetical protein